MTCKVKFRIKDLSHLFNLIGGLEGLGRQRHDLTVNGSFTFERHSSVFSSALDFVFVFIKF